MGPLIEKARAAATKAREEAAAATLEGDEFLGAAREADATALDARAAQMEASGPPVDVSIEGHMARGYRGWDRAWAAIAEKYGDTECRCPETHEAWQYMGTANGEHQFRHRSLGGERAYATVPAQADDFEAAAIDRGEA